jgi:L-asparaginase II
MSNPVLCELTRGGLMESFHRGAVAIADSAGDLVWSAGDVDRPVFGRSALKMLQALPLIESGAADAFDLSAEELALACASHSGEAVHVDAASSWLARIDCDASCLACGAHAPMGEAAARMLLLDARGPSRLHNNCSGKHAGFLTLARHLGVDPAGYERPDHPVQRQALAAIAEMAGLDAASMVIAIDGCAAPAVAFPLRALATAIARIADPSKLAPARAAAARRLDAAVKAHPTLVAGAGRACTAIIAASGGAVSVKTGAEGVYVAVLSGLGLGIALKIDDGAGRAAEATIATLLAELGLVPPEHPDITALVDAPILNTQGQPVGARRLASWLAPALHDALGVRLA